jgi:hypothetical protein
MKALRHAACVLVLAMPAIALAGAGPGCDLINFGADVLAKFPNAAKACHGVSEKNGGIYVHYVGEVVAVDKEAVTVHFLDVDGKALSKVKFAPAADQTAKLEGKATKYTDLKKGTKLDFWIEHNKWGLFSSPDDKAMKILSQEML